MGWIDSITQAFYSWQQQVISVFNPGSSTEGYVNPEDDDEDDEAEWETYSYVEYGTPLRETKCLFVPEMPDFFTDSELNTVYHSKEEYANAVIKYGLVYKSQKFANADTTQKLLDYATDWIKNNYHGGITNFTVTALDLHLMDPSFRKYTVGQRVYVVYMDPSLREETSQTLTVITAEYDLNNPDKNSYKIGIPDVTLNKVYGETSKSGGGGGGGGKPSDETDDETNTEVDGLIDNAEADAAQKLEMIWAMLYKGAKNGEDDFQLGDLITPNSKDPTSDWTYGLTSDIMRSSRFQGVQATINSVQSEYLKATKGVDAKKASINDAHTVNINNDETTKTKDLEASNNATVDEKTTTKDLEVTGTANIKVLKVDGQEVSGGGIKTTVKVTIDGTKYTLQGKTGW